MLLMSEPVFELRKQIKTTALADAALGRIVSNLRGSNRVRWKGKRVTQEAVFAAVWMWLEELGPDAVEEAMVRHVPRLEALMRGEPDTGLGPPAPAERHGVASEVVGRQKGGSARKPGAKDAG